MIDDNGFFWPFFCKKKNGFAEFKKNSLFFSGEPFTPQPPSPGYPGWNGYENYDDPLFESPKSISSLDYDEIYSDDSMKPPERNVPNVPEYYYEDNNNHEEMLEFTQYNNGNWGCSGQASFYDLIGRERK